ncbi:MAG: 4a-hydroxytetrahydrobiopterin dehydratase [Sulfuricella sp.]
MSDDYEPNAAPSAPQERLPTLSRRFDFGSYAETRQFLDQLADLSKREDYYPNVSFGKTYANVSIDGEGLAALSERKSAFISEMEALAAEGKA